MEIIPIEELQDRIQAIKSQLADVGEMRPGSISEQYNVCGTPNCRCKDPVDPKKHGPYYQLSYSHQGKSTSEFVKPEHLEATRQQLENYRLFRDLTKEWVALSVGIAKSRRAQARR